MTTKSLSPREERAATNVFDITNNSHSLIHTTEFKISPQDSLVSIFQIINKNVLEDSLARFSNSDYKLFSDDIARRFEVLDGMQIFYSTCKKKEKKSDSKKYCDVCQNKYALITKNCSFCGKLVCAKDIVKRRPHPKNKDEFKKICSVCELQYLERRFLKPFTIKYVERRDLVNNKSQKVRSLEIKVDTLDQEIAFIQNDILSINNDPDYERLREQVDFTKNEGLKLSDATKSLSYEEETLDESLEDLRVKNSDLNLDNLEQKDKLERTKEYKMEIDKQITSIE